MRPKRQTVFLTLRNQEEWYLYVNIVARISLSHSLFSTLLCVFHLQHVFMMSFYVQRLSPVPASLSLLTHSLTYLTQLTSIRYVSKLRDIAKIEILSCFRLFHVSIWNSSPSGHPRCSIGDIDKKDDRLGESFVATFGPLLTSTLTKLETPTKFKKKVLVLPDVPRLAAQRSAERRRLEKDTRLLQRLGATCRMASDKAECKFKFPKTLHCMVCSFFFSLFLSPHPLSLSLSLSLTLSPIHTSYTAVHFFSHSCHLL